MEFLIRVTVRISCMVVGGIKASTHCAEQPATVRRAKSNGRSKGLEEVTTIDPCQLIRPTLCCGHRTPWRCNVTSLTMTQYLYFIPFVLNYYYYNIKKKRLFDYTLSCHECIIVFNVQFIYNLYYFVYSYVIPQKNGSQKCFYRQFLSHVYDTNYLTAEWLVISVW